MLHGQGSCGKTTTLNIVYAELIIAGATIRTPRSPVGGEPMDFEVELDYTNKAGKNKRVAIYTQGDFSCCVIAAMKKYAAIGVDVLVIACNCTFKKPLKQMSQYPGSSAPISKTSILPATRTLDEIRLANSIIAMI
jgi:hypothetical protein